MFLDLLVPRVTVVSNKIFPRPGQLILNFRGTFSWLIDGGRDWLSECQLNVF